MTKWNIKCIFSQMAQWRNENQTKRNQNGQKYNEFHSIRAMRDCRSIGAWRGGGYGTFWRCGYFGAWGDFGKRGRSGICAVVGL